jgi:hypothetical protein
MGYPVTTPEASDLRKPSKVANETSHQPDFAPYISGIHARSEPKPQGKTDGHAMLDGFVLAGNAQPTKVRDATPQTDKGVDERKQHTDGSAYTRHKNRDGSIEHIGTGQAPGDNFHVHELKDGSYKVVDEKNRDLIRSKDPDVVAQRGRLDSLSSNFTDPESKARFRADMAKLEERMKGNPKEVALTYSEIASMLEQRDKAKIKPEAVDRLAQDVMSQAATPKSVDQGTHPTCNVTSVESVMYHDNPSVAANALKDVALRGEHQVASGNVVQVDAQSLQPSSLDKRQDGQRSLATQYMNVLMVNAALAERGDGTHYTADDRRIKETAGRPPEDVGKTPSLSLGEIARSYKLMMGDKAKPTIIVAHESAAEKDANGAIKKVDGVEYYKDQQDYERLLQRLKATQGLPVVGHIDVRNNFSPPDRSCSAPDSDTYAGHVLGLDDIANGKVEINNQWGSKCDYSIPVKQAYQASVDKEIEYMDRIESAKKHGTRDFAAELAHSHRLLRQMRRIPGYQLSSPEALKEMEHYMTEAESLAQQGKPETFNREAAEEFSKMAIDFVDRGDRPVLAEKMRRSPIFNKYKDIIDVVDDVS